jgi:hypothetical protein
MVIFNSYVSLPEGKTNGFGDPQFSDTQIGLIRIDLTCVTWQNIFGHGNIGRLTFFLVGKPISKNSCHILIGEKAHTSHWFRTSDTFFPNVDDVLLESVGPTWQHGSFKVYFTRPATWKQAIESVNHGPSQGSRKLAEDPKA